MHIISQLYYFDLGYYQLQCSVCVCCRIIGCSTFSFSWLFLTTSTKKIINLCIEFGFSSIGDLHIFNIFKFLVSLCIIFFLLFMKLIEMSFSSDTYIRYQEHFDKHKHNHTTTKRNNKKCI